MKFLIYLLITSLGFSNVSADILNKDIDNTNISIPMIYESIILKDEEVESDEIVFIKDNKYWDKIILYGNENVEYKELRGENRLVLELPKDYILGKTPAIDLDTLIDFEIRNISDKQYLYLEHKENLPIRIYKDTLDKNVLHIAIGKTENPYNYKVVLDAGHGGYDPGASYNGTHEKNIVLDMVFRMEHKLKDLGIDVAYTRNGDYFVVLNDRPKISNQIRPDAFISLHINANLNKGVSGNGVYIYTKNNRLVAEKRQLARAIQSSLKEEFPTWRDHGVIEKNLCVTRETKDTSVLVEFGFLSNNKDRELLKQETIRDKGAEAISKGIYEYFSNK